MAHRFVAFALLASLAVAAPAGARTGQLAPGTPALRSAAGNGIAERNGTLDAAKLTPEELRLMAQNNYAKGIASLRKEAAGIEAARLEIGRELEGLTMAKDAAKSAMDEVQKAKTSAEKKKADAVAAGNKTGAEAGRVSKAQAYVAKESAELDAATKAYKDVAAAEAALRSKMAVLDKKQQDLSEESSELESAQSADARIIANLRSAKAQLAAAEELASAEENKKVLTAKADAAAKAVADAKAGLAAAASGSGKGTGNQAKAAYEKASEAYTKVKNDLVAAEARIQRATQELSKQDQEASPRGGGGARSSPRRLKPGPRPAPGKDKSGAPAASAIVASAASVSLLASL